MKQLCTHRYLLFFLIFFCSGISMESMAQVKNSSLKIVTNQGDALKNSRFSYSIYKGDTLKSITKIPNDKRFEKDHILPCGKYIIQIYKDDSIYHEFKEIELECGYKMVYTINLDAKTSYEMFEKSEQDMFSTVTPFSTNHEYIYPYMNFGYGMGILEENPYPVQHLFRYGAGGFFNFPITRHIGFGYNPESVFELILPKKGHDLRPNQNYRHERYFHWNLKIGFYLRFSTFNMKQTHNGGMFLDIGGGYQLPIYFRHVGLYDNHKDVTRSIHQFNDVSLNARIGSDAFSIYCQYRLFDYVKNPYPQAPILSFGICVRMKE